jgi:cytoskeleton-associated protein 5
VLKSLPKIFSNTDKNVRAEGALLTHILYQYLGSAIEPWLADLKPVQVKELKEAFEDMDKGGRGKGSLKPERLTRAQAREVEAAGDMKDGDEPSVGQEEEGTFLFCFCPDTSMSLLLLRYGTSRSTYLCRTSGYCF